VIEFRLWIETSAAKVMPIDAAFSLVAHPPIRNRASALFGATEA